MRLPVPLVRVAHSIRNSGDQQQKKPPSWLFCTDPVAVKADPAKPNQSIPFLETIVEPSEFAQNAAISGIYTTLLNP
jgi:hypothetical protein